MSLSVGVSFVGGTVGVSFAGGTVGVSFAGGTVGVSFEVHPNNNAGNMSNTKTILAIAFFLKLSPLNLKTRPFLARTRCSYQKHLGGTWFINYYSLLHIPYSPPLVKIHFGYYQEV
ncbi:MAG: hypothetical protein SU899_03835 [Chloroflexota bacterium]|nr:hypothetical protein [Chloroflexota bacterium]